MTDGPSIRDVDLSAMASRSVDANGMRSTKLIHPELGNFHEVSMELPQMKLVETRTKLSQPFEIRYHDNKPCQSVHHCMSVNGFIDLRFKKGKVRSSLKPKSFHYLVMPEEENYSLSYSDALHNFHIAVEIDYYVSLLSETESWEARLREVLHQRRLHFESGGTMTPLMINIMRSVFQSPLTGSLRKIYVEAKAHELIALQLSAAIGQRKASSDKSKDLFFAIREHLDKHFLADHSLKSICQQFAINEFKLKQGFRQHFGTTVFDYLLSLRLEYARQLLYDNKPVNEVASIVGYKYPQHFSTSFKKKFGSSPSELVR
jgi:AraC-like DNA-binding protein